MTRWLTPSEQASWRAYIGATTLLTAALDRDLQREAGIPLSYFEVLVHLSEAPERTARMSELAEQAFSSRSRLSHAVGKLEERGWVRRLPFAGDRRGQVARLTDAGFAALQATAPAHVESVRRLLIDPLSEEQFAALGSLSASVLAALQADRSPADSQERSEAHRPEAQPSGEQRAGD